MAQYQDILSHQKGWLHDLACAEVEGVAEQELQQKIEETTVEFLTELRVLFEKHAKIFNGYSEKSKRFNEIKIYAVAQSAADFMLFRNQVKLVFSNVAHGAIRITLANHSRGFMSLESTHEDEDLGRMATQEIFSKTDPFGEVFWTYQGEKVTPEQLAKFYFCEFARMTRENKKTKSNNQAVLDQIKALLQEKGLDF